MPADDSMDRYWALDAREACARLRSSDTGLSSGEAAARLLREGPNELTSLKRPSAWRLVLRQVENPLVLILVFAALVSGLLGDWSDSLVVCAILATGVGIGFWRERDAGRALEKLLRRLVLEARVLRDGVERKVPVGEIVPGDIVLLAAGSLVPGDGILLDADDLFVSQAALTGETFPVPRKPGRSAPGAPVGARENVAYSGTSVRSGTARLLVVRTGRRTEYGRIAAKLAVHPSETDFDRGLRRFGGLLTKAMFVMTMVVLVVNVLLHRPFTESLLFAVALAVGLAPELLPAILSVNLARSAHAMSESGVVVRRLDAIENLGSMDVLCTDKTGTLTEGEVRLHGAWNGAGLPDDSVLARASVNARLQAGMRNPLDDAILAASPPHASNPEKAGEIPYDFVRRRVSVAVRRPEGVVLLMKGAVTSVVEACARDAGGNDLDDAARARIAALATGWGEQGLRVLAVAERRLAPGEPIEREAEHDMILAGFLTFFDPPKAGAAEVVAALAGLGVQLKVISGDSGAVAAHVAREVGLVGAAMLTGAQLDALDDEGLRHVVERTTLFVEVDPNQKERIILALRKTGHVVGYLGDGINDAPALHAADVGISVEGAVDVAREGANLVLTRRDLDVLRRGILAGRHAFANTLKYILTTTSANLGNMVSMAISSAFLPFLPLTASQILLNNLLSDVPALALSADSVDHELVDRPRRWDMTFIRRYMIEFGLLSSFFDFITFGVLLHATSSAPAAFRTGWFVESLLTELAIALVVRTRRPFWRSAPGRGLWISTLVVACVAVALPFIAPGGFFGFVPLPASVMAAVVGITLAYVAAAEALKRFFFREPRARREPARHGG